MNPLESRNPSKSNIVVTYDKQEALDLIGKLKDDGIQKGDIHIVGKDLIEFANLKWDAEINLHRVGNTGDKMKSLITGEDPEIEGLKHAKLPERELAYYKQIVDGGGVLIYTDEYLHTTKIAKEIKTDPNIIDDSATFDDGTKFKSI